MTGNATSPPSSSGNVCAGGAQRGDKARILPRLLGLLMGAGLFGLFIYIAEFQWTVVLEKFRHGGSLAMVGVLAFTVLLYLVSAQKWSVIIHDLNPSLASPLLRDLFYHISMGYLFGLILPQAVSDVSVRGLALKRSTGLPMSCGVYSVFIDQGTNLYIVAAFMLPAVLLLAGISSVEASMVICLGSVLLLIGGFCFANKWFFIFFGKLYRKAVSLALRLPFARRREGGDPLQGMAWSLSAPVAINVILLSLLRHMVIAVRLYCIIWAMDLSIGFYPLLLCSSLSLILGLVTFLPGQFGLGELGWYSALVLTGASDPDIVVFVVAMRIFSNLAILGIGFIVWTFSLLPNRKRRPVPPHSTDAREESKGTILAGSERCK